MNSWGIPEDVENRVRARDQQCAHCHVRLEEKWTRGLSRKNVASWEHINNERWNDMTMASINVVRSCWACNSSKGTKRLRAWFESAYCKVRGINEQAVADAVKELATQYSDLV